MESTYQIFVYLLTVVVLMAATWYAYNEGYADPLIEKMGVFLMKAKAEAEAKEMQAEGMKRGEDFLDSELKGNQQASDIKAGVGSLGGLKKSL
ncbi:hypothetical protein N0V93_007163 [Gnomoniopsis smithogilvyi]|uniref:Uncharacterized protein n=1 Tax=Gnomoniopsis smithogilvyi TaxID=1191159 RepID=A0A9W9CWB1_9PEZI|nr:hypothetical protein N0V93_007163 [Gnomoniopsis smithogilvyi]